jgi:glutamine amidotransferase/cyclase
VALCVRAPRSLPAKVFQSTGAAAALAAGIFHRREVGIEEVKRHLLDQGIPARL